METIHFVRIQFDGDWKVGPIDPAKEVFEYVGSGTIRVMREGATGVLSTYAYAVRDARAYVIAQDRIVHVPGKGKETPGEVFP